jgi:hypothetical protein
MEQQQIVPKDIIDAARLHAHLDENFSEAEELIRENYSGMNAYHSYIQGRIDERTAHSLPPVKEWDTPSAPIAVRFAGYLQQHYEFCETGRVVQLKGGVQTEIDTVYKLWCERKGIIEQSQSIQPKEDVTEYYVSDHIELLAGKWRTDSGIVTATEDGVTNAENIFAAGYMYAQEEKSSTVGWTDEDMRIAFESGFGYDEEAGSLKFNEWLAEYKLSHPVKVDNRTYTGK